MMCSYTMTTKILLLVPCLLMVTGIPAQKHDKKGKCTYSFSVPADGIQATCGNGKSQNDAAQDSRNTQSTQATGQMMGLMKIMENLLHRQNVSEEMEHMKVLSKVMNITLIAQVREQKEMKEKVGDLEKRLEQLTNVAMTNPGGAMGGGGAALAGSGGINYNRGSSKKQGGVSAAASVLYTDGCPKNTPNRIVEIAPVQKTLHGLIKLVPRSCYEWKLKGHKDSGVYEIDPDGIEGLPPFKVECMMATKPPMAIIHHNQESRQEVDGYEQPGEYQVQVQYTGVSKAQMRALLDVSSQCQQYMKWECRGASLSGNTWWKTHDGRIMKTWGGGDPRIGGCSCYTNRTCAGGSTCNCDLNDNGRWLQDSGYEMDKDNLPVSRMYFGDTGDDNESGFYTLGPLRCKSNVTTSYSGISGFLPVQTYPPFNVFCTPDAWIIIMRRTEMDISFDREWDEFKEGFGDLTGDFFLGLEKMHQLTKQSTRFRLMVEVRGEDNIPHFAQYSYFQIGSEETAYEILLEGFSGSIVDRLGSQNSATNTVDGMAFTTSDQDNDRFQGGNCARYYEGGWWYNNCGESILTARPDRVAWGGEIQNIKSVVLKIKQIEYGLDGEEL